MEWTDDGRIYLPQEELPKKFKKITGTRFAAVLGFSPWCTPFQAWCEITKVWQKPFEDTKYTLAGKAIEPKQAEYMKKNYFMPNLVTPHDIYGADPFKATYGDFFQKNKIFGGMWDYYLKDADGNPTCVLEMKTSKRVEDWSESFPIYYGLQAALYATLMGCDDVMMVATFLDDGDYDNPEDFVPASGNTIVRQFSVSKQFPEMQDYIRDAEAWWKKYVLGGISPQYDEQKDAEVLADLRRTKVDTDKADMKALLSEAEKLRESLDKAYACLKPREDRLKTILEAFRDEADKTFTKDIQKVDITGSRYKWTVAKTESVSLDEEAMKKDGVWEKYHTKVKSGYRLTCKAI